MGGKKKHKRLNAWILNHTVKCKQYFAWQKYEKVKVLFVFFSESTRGKKDQKHCFKYAFFSPVSINSIKVLFYLPFSVLSNTTEYLQIKNQLLKSPAFLLHHLTFGVNTACLHRGSISWSKGIKSSSTLFTLPVNIWLCMNNAMACAHVFVCQRKTKVRVERLPVRSCIVGKQIITSVLEDYVC